MQACDALSSAPRHTITADILAGRQPTRPMKCGQLASYDHHVNKSRSFQRHAEDERGKRHRRWLEIFHNSCIQPCQSRPAQLYSLFALPATHANEYHSQLDGQAWCHRGPFAMTGWAPAHQPNPMQSLGWVEHSSQLALSGQRQMKSACGALTLGSPEPLKADSLIT